jgi:hypothetical protein
MPFLINYYTHGLIYVFYLNNFKIHHVFNDSIIQIILVLRWMNMFKLDVSLEFQNLTTKDIPAIK